MSEKQQSTPSSKSALDNRAKQLNPNNDAFWKARGLSRPAPTPGNKGKGS